jgi:hypothetical protein
MRRIVTRPIEADGGADGPQTIPEGSVVEFKPIVQFSAGSQFYEFNYSGFRCIVREHELRDATQTA